MWLVSQILLSPSSPQKDMVSEPEISIDKMLEGPTDEESTCHARKLGTVQQTYEKALNVTTNQGDENSNNPNVGKAAEQRNSHSLLLGE